MVDRAYTEKYWGTTQDYAKFKESYFPEDESLIQHQRSRFIANLFGKLGYQSVLEVGSNFGRNLYHIKKAVPSARVAGIDINKDAVEFCRTKVDGEFVLGSIYDLDKHFKEPFDIVFTMAVLEHVVPKDFEMVLGKMVKLAKKAVVNFEHNGTENLSSGLAQDKPEWRESAQYLWHHNYVDFYKKNNLPYEISDAPDELLGIGWKHVIISKVPAAATR